MEALSRGLLFPKVVEAYSRPTRIGRGKEVDSDMEVPFSFYYRSLIFCAWKFSNCCLLACPEVYELHFELALFTLKKLTA